MAKDSPKNADVFWRNNGPFTKNVAFWIFVFSSTSVFFCGGWWCQFPITEKSLHPIHLKVGCKDRMRLSWCIQFPLPFLCLYGFQEKCYPSVCLCDQSCKFLYFKTAWFSFSKVILSPSIIKENGKKVEFGVCHHRQSKFERIQGMNIIAQCHQHFIGERT